MTDNEIVLQAIKEVGTSLGTQIGSVRDELRSAVSELKADAKERHGDHEARIRKLEVDLTAVVTTAKTQGAIVGGAVSLVVALAALAVDLIRK